MRSALSMIFVRIANGSALHGKWYLFTVQKVMNCWANRYLLQLKMYIFVVGFCENG